MNTDDDFADMSDVDASGDAERYARLLGRVTVQMRALKERGYDLLNLRPGGHVLDVGAGTGDDAVALAARVAPGGRVVALDRSRELLEKARRHAADHGTAVEFLQGDAHDLALADESFDATRAERVLQHLDDPGKALAEMTRVTRLGGRVLVLDADYDTLSIDASDRQVTRAVLRRRADAAPNGWIGRQLPRLFRDAGLQIETIEGATFICTEHDLAFEIFELETFAERAVADGELSRGCVDAWRAELADRGRNGRFFLGSTGYMVVGRRV